MANQFFNSEWGWLYQHALQENDRDRLLAAIYDAVKLMVRRLHELGPESDTERQKLLVCLGDMRILQISALKS